MKNWLETQRRRKHYFDVITFIAGAHKRKGNTMKKKTFPIIAVKFCDGTEQKIRGERDYRSLWAYLSSLLMEAETELAIIQMKSLTKKKKKSA